MLYSEPSQFVNHLENKIHGDSNIIPYSQYLIETQNAAVQDTNSSAQQDAMILSVFEQLSQQVTNCNKVNKDNLMANETLSTELKRYKERFADFEKENNSLKQTLSEQLKEKESLTKTFNVLKNESKEKEAKNIDKEIALEKKVKELDNIVYKIGFLVSNVKPSTDSSDALPVKMDVPSELPKYSVDKRCLEIANKQALNENDRLLEQIISQDIVNIVVNSSENMNTSVNVKSMETCNKCLELETELIKQQNIRLEISCSFQCIKNDLKKIKEKDIVNNTAQASNATIMAPGMFKLDPHTMEQAAILKEIVEQAKSLNPLDSASYSVCKYVKLIQELLGYVRDTCLYIHKPNEKLVAVTPINKRKQLGVISSMFDARHELCFLEFISDMHANSKSKSVKKAKKKEEWKPIGKVFTKIGYNWRPTGRTFTLVGNACLLTRITATNKMPLRVGVSHETSVARTPQQNGVVERRNRTLVEAARTMLIFTQAPLFLLAEAIATAYNDCENLGKFQGKVDIGIFIGYASKNKAYRFYNRRTRKIIETINVDFDELAAMASEQLDSGPGLQSMTPATSSSGLVSNPTLQQPCNPPPRDDWDHLFQNMFNEYFNPSTIVVSTVLVDVIPRAVDSADSPVSTSIDQDAPSTNPLHESLHEDLTSHGSSSNVRLIHTPFKSLGRWTKDHPIANVIGDPSRSFSTRKQLRTDAMWCYFDAFLTSIEPKNFKQAMIEPP
ncbi:retrovirus-related pol polyprotein from transposon TNT 1-94 [Tanacetum coccineum]